MVFSNEYIDVIRKKAIEFNAKKVILFGSAIDYPENCNDIDLACDISGLDLFLFGSKLEEMLKMPIDIIPINNNDPFMNIVNKYGKVIYES
jgi:predicted nucleotidyltransferase